jgi:hypothetical protein
MKIQDILNYITRQLEAVSKATVLALKGHMFSVRVSNFPKTQTVKGTVTVGNQKNLERGIKDLQKRMEKIAETIVALDFPTEMTVKNIKDTPIPEKTIIPEYPKQLDVTVKNPQDKVEVTNLGGLSKQITQLEKAVKGLKLDPKINVDAPQVNVEAAKPPVVNIPESEKLVSDDPKKFVPVRLTDGKKFYEAINEFITSAGRLMFSTSTGKKDQALIDDNRRIQVVLYSQAIDGPLAGQPVPIKSKYNSTYSAYELLTAGSGTTTTVTDTTNTLLNQDGGNLLLQNGGELLLQV